MKLIKEHLVNKNQDLYCFRFDFVSFVGRITFDQDILDGREIEKLNDTNLFKTNAGRMRKSI